MSKRWLKHRSCICDGPGSEAGQALVELALSMSLLMLVLLGAIEFARVTYVAIEVSNAARAAVQYGAVYGTFTDTAGMLAAAQEDSYNLGTNVSWASGYPAAPVCYCANGVGSSTCTPGDCPGSHIQAVLYVKMQMTFTPLFTFKGLPTQFVLTGYAQQQVLGLP